MDEVNLRAQTRSPCGTYARRGSLVTDPTNATILPLNLVLLAEGAALSEESILTILEIDIGYRFKPDWLSLLWTTVLNLESVLRLRNA